MFSEDITNHLSGKIKAILKITDKLDGLDPEILSLPACVSFFPLFLHEGEIKVQVGTKDRPRGLSVTECSFIAIVDGKSYEVIRFISTEQLKLYMKLTWEKIPGRLIKDIETKIINYKEFEQWAKNQLM